MFSGLVGMGGVPTFLQGPLNTVARFRLNRASVSLAVIRPASSTRASMVKTTVSFVLVMVVMVNFRVASLAVRVVVKFVRVFMTTRFLMFRPSIFVCLMTILFRVVNRTGAVVETSSSSAAILRTTLRFLLIGRGIVLVR